MSLVNKKETFKGVCSRLDSLDSVLNEESLKKTIEEDNKLNFKSSILAMMQDKTKESRYLLIETTLSGDGQEYKRLFFRGFERFYLSHIGPADKFMSEINSTTEFYFNFPGMWPSTKEKDDKYIEQYKGRLTLKISALGGGKYCFENNTLNVYGSSQSFGRVPDSLMPRLNEMMRALVQREHFKGYDVSVSNC